PPTSAPPACRRRERRSFAGFRVFPEELLDVRERLARAIVMEPELRRVLDAERAPRLAAQEPGDPPERLHRGLGVPGVAARERDPDVGVAEIAGHAHAA